MKFDKNKLKDFQDTKIEKVDCPEWAEIGFGEVYVRTMTGTSRDNYEMATYHASQVDAKVRVYNMRAEMVVATACDEEGELIFDKSDIEWLGTKSGAVLDRLFDAAQKLAGISAKDLEEMEKSLEADRS